MLSIKNIKLSMMEIGQALAKDDLLQRLLVIDSPDALTKSNYQPKTFNELLQEKYVCLAPKIENGIKNNSRNTFILIQLDNIDFSKRGNTGVTGSIFIATDGDHVLMENNTNRLWEMIDRIAQVLDSTKFSSAGQVEVEWASNVVYSEYTSGYRIAFKFKDQENRKAEL